MLHESLLIVGIVLFAIAAFWTPEPPRLNLIASGLAFFAASFLTL